jgi:trimethylamine:corrinoid methyltransferase-like protein
MDDIFEVGIGGHFLGRRSTRQHARSEVWRPRAFRKGTFEEFAGHTLVEEAGSRAREIIATHEVPALSEDVERHIDDVIARWTAAR